MTATIHLWGELGERFQPETKLEVSTFREARLALCTVFEGFKNYVLEHPEYVYSVVVKGVNWEKELTLEDDAFPLTDLELYIVPVLEGSGQIGQFIGGLLLIGIGIATGGIGLILAGVAMLLTSASGNKTKAPDPQSAFINQANLQMSEGNPVAVVCGVVLFKTPQCISYQVRSDRQ
jgi:predicted phage tail protein